MPQFCYRGRAGLHGSKDRFDRQRAQAGDVQGWATDIFFARLTGETRKHRAMPGLVRDPVDTVRRPHDAQGRYALADRHVQGSRITPDKEIGLRQQCCQRMQVPGRDEYRVRARCGSDGLYLGFLPRSPEQQYPRAQALAEQIDQGAKMGPGPLPGRDMMRGVDAHQAVPGCDGMGA